jgi:hypothetical protein
VYICSFATNCKSGEALDVKIVKPERNQNIANILQAAIPSPFRYELKCNKISLQRIHCLSPNARIHKAHIHSERKIFVLFAFYHSLYLVLFSYFVAWDLFMSLHSLGNQFSVHRTQGSLLKVSNMEAVCSVQVFMELPAQTFIFIAILS